MAAPAISGHPIEPRRDGYAPLGSYAAIGDGRTVALVAPDGSVDWLCLPDLDSRVVFWSLLDPEAGGGFALRPAVGFDVSRRYLAGSNVLLTTFTTSEGIVEVTDAMTVPTTGALSPQRELVREVRAVSGRVPMRWEVIPRFGFTARRTRIGRRREVPVATSGNDAIALCSWDAGEVHVTDSSISGCFEAAAGTKALLCLSAAHQEPLITPASGEVRARLAHTDAMWRNWSSQLSVGGRWDEAVVRSTLALKLLVYAPSGAIAAAATTSLPETLGGVRNWDYRFCWVRDSALILNALLRLGCTAEAEAFFWWLMQASQLTHPRLRVLYRLDGGPQTKEKVVPVSGYRRSVPVRIGNAASGQVQLDVYGDLLQAAWLYAQSGRRIDADIARRLAEITDLVCRIWPKPDSGLWEVRSEPRHFTQSKMMCAIAVERALQLADAGHIGARHADDWRSTLDDIRHFIETRCWSDTKASYTRWVGSEELDASVLLGVIFAYHPPDHPRLQLTVEAIRRELTDGMFVYRYSGDDGLAGQEGAFLTCSFWLVEALSIQGRHREAAALMDQLVGLANDVGLFAEEIDPATGGFLGNLPQGLTHLSLINAALTFNQTGGER